MLVFGLTRALTALCLRNGAAERTAQAAGRGPVAPPVPATALARPAPLLRFVPPTPQSRLHEDSTTVFMPTASGTLESALYGSTRTGQYGGSLLPRFHEGIDIAPTARDRRGAPLDAVMAAAGGEVVYFNRHGGNSSYGTYVVVRHLDPVGPVYTLYAHLAALEPGLHRGQTVQAGDRLGRMGNTSTLSIPMARAHLHFEVGVMLNPRYDAWFRAQKLKPDHGLYNGGNLTGVDPLPVFRAAAPDGSFSMQDYLRRTPHAFTLAVRTTRRPLYFDTHPPLWQGEPWQAGVLVLSVSEGGVPLAGRNATPEEAAALGSARAVVLDVSEDVLGRNGRRLVVNSKGRWSLGRNGEEWLELLLYR